MVGVVDLPADVFGQAMAEGGYTTDEGPWSYTYDGNRYYLVTLYSVWDTKENLVGFARAWELVSQPPSHIPVTTVPPGSAPSTEDLQLGEIGQLETVDGSGNVTGTIDGLRLDADDFESSLAEGVPSHLRYSYWVSLFDGDVIINDGQHGGTLEVGAGGTATVNAGGGNDILRVWHSKNVIYNGGAGIDRINFNAGADLAPPAIQSAVVNLATGTGVNPFGGTLTFTGVEDAAGVFDQTNILIGNNKANWFTSGGLADTIQSGGGDDTLWILYKFVSGPVAIQVDGGKGNDTAYFSLSMGVTNTLDLVTPAANSGRFEGGSFANIETFIAVGPDIFDFRGSGRGETAIGSGGNDILAGRGGNDTLQGGFGADTLDGGKGLDVADYSDNFFATIVAKIAGANTTITVNGVQQDTLIGIEGVRGGGGNDTLTGDNKANELDGSWGKDVLRGNGGNDHFVFTSLSVGTSADVIKDFKPGKDSIDLDDLAFSKLGSSVSSGEFLKVTSGHAAKDKDDRLIYNSKDGSLWYDADGSGKAFAAVKFAVLTGSPDGVAYQDFDIV